MDDDRIYPLDDWEDFFDRDIRNREKVWDEADDYGANEHGPLDMVEDNMMHGPVPYGSDERRDVSVKFQGRIDIEKEGEAFSRVQYTDIPGSPLHGERFGRVAPPAETPLGLLDKPDRRDAPLNPFKYKLREKAGLSTGSSRYNSFGFSKLQGSGSSVWCKEKHEWLSFPSGCEGCDRLVDADFFGLICRYNLDWHIEVTKNFARDGKTLYFDSKDWDILRGDPEFRELVEKHDREELDYMERSLELSERDGTVNHEMREMVEQYKKKGKNPRGLNVRPVRNLR